MEVSQLFSIYELEKRDKHKLQKLPDNFYKKLSTLIHNYRSLLSKLSPDSPQYRRMLLELSNLRELIENLISLRLNKILHLAFFEAKEGIKPTSKENLTKEEEVLYNIVLKSTKSFLMNITDPITKGESPKLQDYMFNIKKNLEKILLHPETTVVVFTKDFDPIVGPDGKVYGPFKAEDIVVIPPDIAERLASLGVCKVIRL